MEQRAVIKFHAKLGMNALETFQLMQQVYGANCLNETSVFQWHKLFSEGRESLEDDDDQERQNLDRTREMVERVRNFIENEPNASLKDMEKALNIKEETIRIILYKDLGKTKPYKKTPSFSKP